MRRKDIYRMAEAFVQHFIVSYDVLPMAIVIDLDHTPAITNGGQKMNLFNTKYQDCCYLPLLVFEGLSGKLTTAILRSGKTPTGSGNAAILKRIIKLIRKRWSKTHLLVGGSNYVLGKGAGHKTALRPKVKERLDEARQAFKTKTALVKLNNMPEPERLCLYGETEYQAKS